jgi:hypothetical protein
MRHFLMAEVLFALCVTPLVASAQANRDLVNVSGVIEAVKQEIRAAESVVIGEPRLELVAIELEVSVVVSKSADGSIAADVIPIKYGPSAGIGGQASTENLQKIVLSLVPLQPELLQAGVDLSSFEIARTIVALRRELQRSLATPPRFVPASLELQISFSAERMVNAEGKVKLVILDVGAKGSYSRETTQSLTLKFRTPALPR